MRSLQGDAHGRLGLHAELGHALDERVLQRRDRPLGELPRDRLVDLGRAGQQLLVDRWAADLRLPRGLVGATRLSHDLLPTVSATPDRNRRLRLSPAGAVAGIGRSGIAREAWEA